jgi:hypothetical protein
MGNCDFCIAQCRAGFASPRQSRGWFEAPAAVRRDNGSQHRWLQRVPEPKLPPMIIRREHLLYDSSQD